MKKENVDNWVQFGKRIRLSIRSTLTEMYMATLLLAVFLLKMDNLYLLIRFIYHLVIKLIINSRIHQFDP